MGSLSVHSINQSPTAASALHSSPPTRQIEIEIEDPETEDESPTSETTIQEDMDDKTPILSQQSIRFYAANRTESSEKFEQRELKQWV